MKPKSYPTIPFQVKYRIWDDQDKEFVFETKDRDELYAVYRESYARARIPQDFNGWDYERNTRPRYVVQDQFGDEVNWRVSLYEFWYPRRSNKKSNNQEKYPDVRFTADNPNKIKRGYYVWESYWKRASSSYNKHWFEYPYKLNHFRRIRTANEHRQNAACVQDIGPAFVRGRRRGKTLPSSWDDLPNSSQFAVKSWKHHSKRRKQWKSK